MPAIRSIKGNAIYPTEVITKYPGLQRPTLILVCRQLIRNGLVKSPGEALRYLEDNQVDWEKLLEDTQNHFIKKEETKKKKKK